MGEQKNERGEGIFFDDCFRMNAPNVDEMK